jgi:hypothetical protein
MTNGHAGSGNDPSGGCAGGVLFVGLGLLILFVGAYFLLGESQSKIGLYNPTTQQWAECGRSMHGGGPSDEELAERDRCIHDYAAKGFRIATPDDWARR